MIERNPSTEPSAPNEEVAVKNETVVEIMTFMLELVELNRKIGSKQVLLEQMRAQNELSLHNRDRHSGYCDTEAYLKRESVGSDELRALFQEEEALKERIKKLLAQ